MKKTRKSDILILNVAYFAISTYHCGRVKWSCAVVVGVPQGIVGNTIALLSRACIRVRARAFQQRCCFFAVTSVTRREKNREIMRSNQWGNQQKVGTNNCLSMS